MGGQVHEDWKARAGPIGFSSALPVFLLCFTTFVGYAILITLCYVTALYTAAGYM